MNFGANGIFFINGPEDNGKTYLYHALLVTTRLRGMNVIAITTSSIASSIMSGGQTSHSRLKYPLTLMIQVCAHKKAKWNDKITKKS